MKLITKNFSIYLNNTYNYNQLLNNWLTSLTNVYSIIRKGFFLSNEFKYTKRTYLKYPSPFKRIKDTQKYNYNKIYNLSNATKDTLIKAIPDKLLYIKLNIDKIPEIKYDFEFDYDLQKSYFEYLTNTSNFDCYSIMGETYSNLKVDYRFIEQYFSKQLIYSLLKKNTNIKEKVAIPILADDFFSRQSIKDEFVYFLNSYTIEDLEVEDESVEIDYNQVVNDEGLSIIDNLGSFVVLSLPEVNTFGPELSMYTPKNDKYVEIVKTVDTNLDIKSIKEDRDVIVTNARFYKDVIAEELSLIILRHIYSSYKESPIVIQKHKDIIVQHVLNIPSRFFKYIKDLDIPLDISDEISEIYFQLISLEFLKHLQLDIPSDLDKEYKIVNYYLNKISTKSLRDYMLLQSIYRNDPDKYLNTLAMNIKEYVLNDILPIKERFLTEHDVYADLQATLRNQQYFEKVYALFLDYFDDNNWSNSGLYIISKYFGNLFSDFIDSDIFKEWCEELLVISNNALIVYGYTDETHNYYKCIDAIKLYMLVFLRKHILSGELFKNLTKKINDYQQTMQFTHKLTLSVVENEFPIVLDRTKLEICEFTKDLYRATVQKQLLYDLLTFFRS